MRDLLTEEPDGVRFPDPHLAATLPKPDVGRLDPMASEPTFRPTTGLDQRREDARLRRLSRQALAAAGLFERRPELKDVAAWSDGVIESVLWSA